MLESVFRAALGVKTGLVGTIQILIDGVSIPSAMTILESVHVHALLSLMGQRGVRCAAMEVSSYAIDYRRVDGVRYAMSGFTNLTQDHLDLHGKMKKYYRISPIEPVGIPITSAAIPDFHAIPRALSFPDSK